MIFKGENYGLLDRGYDFTIQDMKPFLIKDYQGYKVYIHVDEKRIQFAGSIDNEDWKKDLLFFILD